MNTIIGDGNMIKSLEEARQFFDNDKYATEATGIEIEKVEEGYSLVSLKLDKKHQNAGGSVMGGVYYTMADFAFGVASNYNRPSTVTLDSQITFLTPATGRTLFAEAKVVRDGEHTCCYNVEVYDDLGTMTAVANMNGFKVGAVK